MLLLLDAADDYIYWRRWERRGGYGSDGRDFDDLLLDLQNICDHRNFARKRIYIATCSFIQHDEPDYGAERGGGDYCLRQHEQSDGAERGGNGRGGSEWVE